MKIALVVFVLMVNSGAASAVSLCASNKAGVVYTPQLSKMTGSNGVTITQTIGTMWIADDSKRTVFTQLGNTLISATSGETITCF